MSLVDGVKLFSSSQVTFLQLLASRTLSDSQAQLLLLISKSRGHGFKSCLCWSFLSCPLNTQECILTQQLVDLCFPSKCTFWFAAWKKVFERPLIKRFSVWLLYRVTGPFSLYKQCDMYIGLSVLPWHTHVLFPVDCGTNEDKKVSWSLFAFGWQGKAEVQMYN